MAFISEERGKAWPRVYLIRKRRSARRCAPLSYIAPARRPIRPSSMHVHDAWARFASLTLRALTASVWMHTPRLRDLPPPAGREPALGLDPRVGEHRAAKM